MPHHPRGDAPSRLPPPHAVLGLSCREDDAVKVIDAARILLRRWRRVRPGDPQAGDDRAGEARLRVRQIIAARQAMLERILARSQGG